MSQSESVKMPTIVKEKKIHIDSHMSDLYKREAEKKKENVKEQIVIICDTLICCCYWFKFQFFFTEQFFIQT